MIACLGQDPDSADDIQATPSRRRASRGVVGDQEIRSDLLREKKGLCFTPVKRVSYAARDSQRRFWSPDLQPPFGERALNGVQARRRLGRSQYLIPHCRRNDDLLEQSIEEAELVDPGEMDQWAGIRYGPHYYAWRAR